MLGTNISRQRMQQIKPPRLRAGDVVGIVSPSWCGAALYPHRVRCGTLQLEALGYRVRLGTHAMNQSGFVSDNPQNRVRDLHDFFLDPEVKLVIAAIGGDHGCHLLPHIDFDLLARHPTALMGFSDMTVLNVAVWTQTGLTTFNGPALLTDFAEYPEMFDYTRSWFERTLTRPEALGKVDPSTWWTEEFLDWGEQLDLERPRSQVASTGWSWLRRRSGEGRLVGGCLESLQHLRGTRFWPSWEDTILFVETSEEAPSPEKVDGILMDYQNMGVFDRIQGLLVGRPMKYSASEKDALCQVLLERTKGYDFAVVANMDFGHTAPQITLPIGCRARIDGANSSFEVIDAAVC